MARVRRLRPRVDDSPLARRIGTRLRQARLAAGLTQQQLAEGRYTKAYVSALENGLSRPSMAALDFFAARLGVPASALINDEPPAWARLEADLALARGRWEDALGAYRDLLEKSADGAQRAELQRGLAEALTRLGRGRDAIAVAADSAAVFHRLGRVADASIAEYWLSSAQYEQGNTAEAKALLEAILGRVRAGLRVEPDFEVRLLMAMSSNESRDGHHAAALAYLEEIRSKAEGLDDRRRAVFLHDLAFSYRETGDFEAAVRTGIASLELYRRADAERESAMLENDLALSFLALSNTARAEEYAAASRRRLEKLDDAWWLAHVLDTQAQIALARGDADTAASAATEAVTLAERLGNGKAAVDGLLTLARARRTLGQDDAALATLERAAGAARSLGAAVLLRRALGEWAEALAAVGQHERAFSILREAISTS